MEVNILTLVLTNKIPPIRNIKYDLVDSSDLDCEFGEKVQTLYYFCKPFVFIVNGFSHLKYFFHCNQHLAFHCNQDSAKYFRMD